MSRPARPAMPLEEEAPDLVDDPYTEAIVRDPVRDEVDVVVVGAGFGGLVAAARLKEAGVARVRIVDTAGDVGGTWYWNRYPGAACDVESYIYLPFLEELGYIPKHRYSFAPEILGHAKAIAKHFGLYDLALFQTKVTGMEWHEDRTRWRICTNRGDDIRATYVVLSVGFLSAPKVAAIPGLAKFDGTSFHTSRWDYAYTGGDAEGDDRLVGLVDKVVGVIGTGATAIQVVPRVGEWAKALFVFQRTPSAVAPRDNQETDPEWAESLTPGWQAERMRSFTAISAGDGTRGDLVQDGWTDLFGEIMIGTPAFATMPPEEAQRARELADITRMGKVHRRVESIVRDPQTAEALKPYYYYLCKRPCFHDEYLETFNRPNVTLVDAPHGVEQIYEKGVVANGVAYPLDCLIFSTGFESYFSPFRDKAGFEITGRNGMTLTEKHTPRLQTLHGVMTGGFPNMFFMPVPFHQASSGINHMHLVLENSAHIAYVITEMRKRRIRTVDVEPAAEEAWAERVATTSQMARFFETCTPSHFNNEGHTASLDPGRAAFPNPLAYFKVLEAWRNDGRFEGLVCTPED